MVFPRLMGLPDLTAACCVLNTVAGGGTLDATALLARSATAVQPEASIWAGGLYTLVSAFWGGTWRAQDRGLCTRGRVLWGLELRNLEIFSCTLVRVTL